MLTAPDTDPPSPAAPAPPEAVQRLAAAPETPPAEQVHPRAAWQHREFRFFALARFVAVFGWQMLNAAVLWQIYDITASKTSLAIVGLVQFLPSILLVLLTGLVADRFDRRKVFMACLCVHAACAFGLCAFTLSQSHNVIWIYALLLVGGISRSFMAPASQALMPNTVPAEHLPNAIVWSTSIFQFASIVGPPAGGMMIHFLGEAGVYASAASTLLVAFLMVGALRVDSRPPERKEANDWATLLAGISYIKSNRPVLGAISLDLFAVLFAGSMVLLPVFAKDILHGGSAVMGWLRAAIGMGAAAMAVYLAHRPPFKRPGMTMLFSVVMFGIMTIVFALSKNFYLSFVALFLMSAFDMISVVIRQTMVLTLTPKEMLGRVNAVNMLFITASNELGDFEAGLAAEYMGTVPSVVFGGAGSIGIALLWGWMFPALREYGIKKPRAAAPAPGTETTTPA